MFRAAWFSCIRASLFINAFCEAGICPFNPGVIEQKLSPSLPYSSTKQPHHTSATSTKIADLQSIMKPETLKLYEERYEEGFDVERDELYDMWSKMKQLTLSEPSPCLEKEKEKEEDEQDKGEKEVPLLHKKQRGASPVLDEVLTYPNPTNPTLKT